MKINEIIKYPILTEKSYQLMADGVYVFAVDRKTNRAEVKKSVEIIFDVKVVKVNIFNVPKKPAKLGRFKGFANAYKKAFVTLAEGHSINLLNEEVEEKQTKDNSEDVTEVKTQSPRETKDASEIEKKVAEKLASKANKEN